MKEIILKEILKECRRENKTSLNHLSVKQVINAMREACNQTIDLCAENANTHIVVWGLGEDVEVDKESILKTKEQIK